MMADSDKPSELQQALMERARLRWVDAALPAKRPSVVPKVACFAIASCIVVAVFFGFDRFLTALQRYIVVQTAEPPPPAASSLPDRMPVFVVVDETPAPEQSGAVHLPQQAPGANSGNTPAE